MELPIISRYPGSDSYTFTFILYKIHMAIPSFPYIFHLLDKSLSSGQCYPPFEQLGPGVHVMELPIISRYPGSDSYTFIFVLYKIHMAIPSFPYIFHLLDSSLSSG